MLSQFAKDCNSSSARRAQRQTAEEVAGCTAGWNCLFKKSKVNTRLGAVASLPRQSSSIVLLHQKSQSSILFSRIDEHYILYIPGRSPCPLLQLCRKDKRLASLPSLFKTSIYPFITGSVSRDCALNATSTRAHSVADIEALLIHMRYEPASNQQTSRGAVSKIKAFRAHILCVDSHCQP